MEMLTPEEYKTFLRASGYQTLRKQICCSFSMREFSELVDSKVPIDSDGKCDEDLFVKQLLDAINEELPLVRIS